MQKSAPYLQLQKQLTKYQVNLEDIQVDSK